MFIGRHYHHLESKGRLAIPQDFRAGLKSGGVITRGLDGCLFLFPKSSWQQLSDKLASLPLTSTAGRNFVRLLVQTAVSLNLDSQGRTLIPEYLRNLASLKKNVVIAGAISRIEIWDRDLYHQHFDLIAKEDEQISASLEGLNI
jgi:MraZ protein